MENLIKQLNFDILAMKYLQKIDAAVTAENLNTCRTVFQNNIDTLLDAVLGVDTARAVDSSEVENTRKIRRHKRKAA